jgi:hypothetical protein
MDIKRLEEQGFVYIESRKGYGKFSISKDNKKSHAFVSLSGDEAILDKELYSTSNVLTQTIKEVYDARTGNIKSSTAKCLSKNTETIKTFSYDDEDEKIKVLTERFKNGKFVSKAVETTTYLAGYGNKEVLEIRTKGDFKMTINKVYELSNMVEEDIHFYKGDKELFENNQNWEYTPDNNIVLSYSAFSDSEDGEKIKTPLTTDKSKIRKSVRIFKGNTAKYAKLVV